MTWKNLAALVATLLTPLAAGASGQANILIVLTDDMRWDSVWAMPNVQQRIADQGMTFSKAYATVSWCCPSRSGFLSGGYYPHNTTVHANGHFLTFADDNTIGTRFQASGYATAMVGKYLNQYGPALAPYIPPGWSHFAAVSTAQQSLNWFDFEMAVGSSGASSGSGRIFRYQQYISYAQRDEALAFLDSVGQQPFLLYFSTNAPHYPFTPAPGDGEVYSDFVYDSPGVQEADLTDKPLVVQNAVNCVLGDRPGDELESLLAVDRAVGALLDKLEAQGRLDNTFVIFTSDHGNMWDEHGLCFKGYPYEEAVRVPLLVSGPGIKAGSVDDSLVAVNLDVGATIADLTGQTPEGDGLSFATQLGGQTPVAWREELLLQTFKETIWSGLRVSRADGEWRYNEWGAGDVELYDLAADPHELENIASDPRNAFLIAQFSASLAMKRGVSFRDDRLLRGVVGKPYSFTFSVWDAGGNASVSRFFGPLPPGIVFDDATDTLSGIPTSAGCYSSFYRVVSDVPATHAGINQRPGWSYQLCIDEADADGDGIADGVDNCTLVANTDQRDSNGDGFGNLCDGDLNNDGIVNPVDLGLFRIAFFGVGDLDADLDGDGLVNAADLGLLRSLFFQPPGPSGVATN